MSSLTRGIFAAALFAALTRPTPAPAAVEPRAGESAAPHANSAAAPAPAEPPVEWIDPVTGHRIVRLSRAPGTASLYFHYNPFTAEGDKMVVTTPTGLAVINLKTRAVEPLFEGTARNVIVGAKSRTVYYSRNGVVYATNLDTKATREIAQLPPAIRNGSGFGLSADETLLVGSFVKDDGTAGPDQTMSAAPNASGATVNRSLRERWEQRKPMALYTVNTKTGEVKIFHDSKDWLNHLQMSPTDPTLISFCHEGPWDRVDRIWNIRADGTGLKLMHPRTMPNEIAGHEFFGPHDMLWYDLQTPRSGQFWVGGVNVVTGARFRYPIERSQWSVHYNVSRDGTLFVGDGGGPGSVANRTPLPDNQPLNPPGNGMFIYLFTPVAGPPETIQVAGEDVKVGKFTAEKLADLSKHDYALEPNAHITPDNQWVVFRSNMFGPTHVFAVEIAKPAAPATAPKAN